MSNHDPWATASEARIADRWRFAAENWGSALTDALLEFADLRSDSVVLDLATGSGDPALALAARLRGGRVLALDNSGRGLLLAKRESEALTLPINFVQADVHKLPFCDSPFDRVTCRLGIMFFSDVEAALSEVLRVLKPGGRASFLAWGPFEQPLFESTVGIILGMVRGATLPDPARAMFKFATAGSLTDVLGRSGFHNVQERYVTVSRIWAGSAEALWEYFQQVSALFHPLMQSVPPSVRPELDKAVAAALTRFHQGNALAVPVQLVLAGGHRRPHL